MSNKRVFHPTLNSWKDVPEGDVDTWVELGWRKTKPKHVDDTDSLPVQAADPPPAPEVAPAPKPVKSDKD